MVSLPLAAVIPVRGTAGGDTGNVVEEAADAGAGGTSGAKDDWDGGIAGGRRRNSRLRYQRSAAIAAKVAIAVATSVVPTISAGCAE